MFPFKKNFHLYLALLVAALIIHWGGTVFYYWDEWDILGRFQSEGLATAFKRHNEHFVPIFFGLYFAQVKLFGNFYQGLLLVTALLHALNGVLLAKFLERLNCKSKTAQLAALLCVGSSLHAEVFDWAFVQCVVLMTTLILLALNAAADYFKQGQARQFVLTLLCVAVAPFVFGNGLIAVVLIGLLWLFFYLEQRTAPELLMRGVKLLGSLAVATLAALLIYRGHQDGDGHGLDSAQMFGNPMASAKYLFTGAEFGTIFRGLGFFPALELVSGQKLNQFLHVDFFTRQEPEMLFAKAGFGLSLLILFSALKLAPQNKHHTWLLWIFGQLFIAVSFLLPALGRWNFGLVQALSLRYQVLALVGLSILIAPLLEAALESTLGARRLLGFFLVFFFSVHFAMAHNLTYFTSRGKQNLQFVAELREFKAGQRAMAPNVPPDFCPGKSAEEASKILDWLDR